MDFIAVLNYEQLDNNFFLTSFAKSLAKKKGSGIILHGDSEYTERVIQTGVMREDAELRAIKELNRRLVALLADEGIPAIGINGHQKSAFTQKGEEEISISSRAFTSIPEVPVLILSGLIESESGKAARAPLSALTYAIQKHFNIPEVTIFSKIKNVEIISDGFPYKNIVPLETDQEFKELHIPEVFYQYDKPVILHAPTTF